MIDREKETLLENFAKEILYSNLIKGYSKSLQSEFLFIRPSRQDYPFQFFWDTCFHVFILTTLGENHLAIKSIDTLLKMQEKSGFIGHIHYWNNVLPKRSTDIFQSKPSLGRKLMQSHTSALIQPPLLAQAVERIYNNTNDKAYLQKILPQVKKYYEWLINHRDFDGDGLISIISSFESGMDWKPTYDPVLNFSRRKANFRLFLKVVWNDLKNFAYNYNLNKIKRKGNFLVKDAAVNTIYCQNLYSLANMCREIADEDAEYFHKKADQVRVAILEIMYNEEKAAFFDVNAKTGKQIEIFTPTIFFPLVINDIPESIYVKVIEKHLFDKNKFQVKHPLPSLAINDPAFYPESSLFIWRGPTWIMLNWFMHQFLLDKGYKEESRKLVENVVELIDKSGFREYYNPFNGKGYGARDFTWSCLVLDMVKMEKAWNEKR